MADKTLIAKEAQKYLAKGQIDKAISEWEKLIKESPDGNTYNTIGDLYLKKGDKKNAVDSFHKAAGFFRDEGFSLKALALYKKLLNINQADHQALYALGQLSEEKGLVPDAIKYYLAAADSLSKEGKKDRTLEIYEKILAVSPSNIPLRNKVAEILLKEGLRSDAAKEYITIAQILEDKGDFPKAKEYYQKVLDMQPSNKDAVLGLGVLLEKSGEIKNAAAHMKDAAVLFHSDPDILSRYAEVTYKAGQQDTARDILLKVIGIEPQNIKARRLLGEIYLKSGLRDKAWAEYLPAIDEMILEERYEEAIHLIEPFKDTDPLEAGKRLVSLYRQIGNTDRVADELTNLGNALREKDMIAEATRCYQDALEIRPDDEYVRSLLDELVPKPSTVVQEAPPVEEMPSFAEIRPVEEIPATGEISAGEGTPVVQKLPEGGKTLDEIFVEVDVFSRYGLMSEAIKLLEGLKGREPQNIELHRRLKSMYVDTDDRESAVTECLILHELYKRLGETEHAEQMIRDACELSPEDPRLADKGLLPSKEPEAVSPAAPAEPGEEGLREPEIADYEEELAEANFYARQGLINEASEILEKLHHLFPGNAEIKDMLDNLGTIAGVSEAAEIPEEPAVSGFSLEEPPGKRPAPEETVQQEAAGLHEKEEYEDFTLTDEDLIEAEEMPEPTLDNDVLEIFHEFKKGLEKELGEEDSETHYNLGIAYKEMGLIDDAIRAFQTARNDPKKFIQASSMLGVCYMEKGVYSLAIDALAKAIKDSGAKDDSYWAMKYDLAEACEKNGNLKEALDHYTEVYGWNATFRAVSEKVNQVKKQLGSIAEASDRPKGKKDRVSYL